MSDLIIPESSTYPSKYDDVWPYEQDYAYDIECYPNFFSLTAIHIATMTVYYFEISQWRDDTNNLNDFMYWLSANKCRMLGFNNINYDYYVLHWLFNQIPSWIGCSTNYKFSAIYSHSSAFFNMDKQAEYDSKIWPNERIVEQVDIASIHNLLGRVSLKVMEINMRSANVQELPVKAGSILTYEQALEIREYNKKDVIETIKVFKFSLGELKLRKAMSEKFGFDFTNHSEPKLGEDYFKLKFVEAGANVKLKTPRDHIHVKDIIFPYIKFRNPAFIETLEFLKSQVIVGTKDASYPKPVACGIGWQFGKGGMHGSILATTVHEDDEYEIIDVDVTSFYPRTAIVNNLSPAHLGDLFALIFNQVFDMRKLYEKGTMENLAFKLALNAAYGKSNSPHSFLYDPQFTMGITINGQLMLCMLGEWLSYIPSLTVIQANTDGITFKVKRMYRESVYSTCKQWEQLTKLDLEFAYYKTMYIRDVNNYIAETTSGKLKNKGAYAHSNLAWDKDHSSVIIAKAAERELVHGINVRTTIMECTDPFDFMIKAKVSKAEHLVLRTIDGVDIELQRTTRYFASTDSHQLTIIRKPTDTMIEAWRTGTHYKRERDGDYKVVKPNGKRPAMTYIEVTPTTDIPPDRTERVNAGYMATDCSRSSDFNWNTLNYEYYINEARKLVDPLTV